MMRWLERIGVSALAAGIGAMLALLWVGDRQDTAEDRQTGPTTATTLAAQSELARLAREVAAQADALAQVNADNAELTLRLLQLERGRAAGTGTPVAEAASDSQLAGIETGAEVEQESEEEELSDLPPAELLARAGFEPALAEAIQQRLSSLEMDRLYLRDQATREGWRESDRFNEAMRELVSPEQALREEFGDEVYDQYLYAMGQGNRVRVASTLQDSPADAAGIRAGDTVLSYGGERVYSVRDLQSATTAGQPGDAVVVELLRDGVRWYATVPRGPLGVRLDITRLAPGAG